MFGVKTAFALFLGMNQGMKYRFVLPNSNDVVPKKLPIWSSASTKHLVWTNNPQQNKITIFTFKTCVATFHDFFHSDFGTNWRGNARQRLLSTTGPCLLYQCYYRIIWLIDETWCSLAAFTKEDKRHFFKGWESFYRNDIERLFCQTDGIQFSSKKDKNQCNFKNESFM